MDNYRINHMRLTGDNKEYWLNQLAEFSRRFINKNYGSRNIKGVDFGKQDIRGGFSICLIDEKFQLRASSSAPICNSSSSTLLVMRRISFSSAVFSVLRLLSCC